MVRSTAFASFFALALAAGAAHAEAGNVVGGGGATLAGGGDDMRITYSTGGAGAGGGVLSQTGRIARFAGSNDGLQVEYLTAAPADTGREARLVGGGEDAQVVYR